jgi:hypothetical protein
MRDMQYHTIFTQGEIFSQGKYTLIKCRRHVVTACSTAACVSSLKLGFTSLKLSIKVTEMTTLFIY